jgi:hypothetical protein
MTGQKRFVRISTVIAIPIMAAAIALGIQCTNRGRNPLIGSPKGCIAPVISFKTQSNVIHIPAIVKAVCFTLQGQGFDTTVTVSYSAKQASIANIPVGAISIDVDGLDNDGRVLYHGETVINVVANVTAEPVVSLEPAMEVFTGVLGLEDSSEIAGRTITLSGLIVTDNMPVTVTVNGAAARVAGHTWTHTVLLDTAKSEVIVTATDSKGYEYIDTLTFYYSPDAADTTGPVILVSSLADKDTVASAAILLYGTVSDISGISSVNINGSPAQIQLPDWWGHVALQSGANTIQITAVDSTDSQYTSLKTITVWYDPTIIDTTAPSLSISVPSDGDTVNASSIDVVCVSSDKNNVDTLTIAGEAASQAGHTWSRTVMLSYGLNAIEIRAVDGSPSANAATGSVSVVYDTTVIRPAKPVFGKTTPGSGDTVWSAQQTIGIEVNASAGMDFVTIGGDSAAYNSSSKFYERSVTLHVGLNTLEIIAQDNSYYKNRDTTALLVFYDIDSIAPAVDSIVPRNGDTVTSASQWITLRATDDKSGVGLVKIGGDSAAYNGTSGRYEREVSLTPGPNTVEIIAHDRNPAPNIDTTGISLFYDNSPPVITLNQPADITHSSVRLTWGESNDPDFAAYRVYYSTTPNVTTSSTLDTTVTEKLSTSLIIDGLMAHTRYYFRVFVLNSAASSGSNEVNAVTANRKPVFSNPGAQMGNEGATLTFVVSATDADSDGIAYSMPQSLLSPGMSAATFDPPLRQFSWTPGMTDAGVYSATFVARDDAPYDPKTDSLTVSITINNLNRPPSFQTLPSELPDTLIVTAPWSKTLTATDPDSEPLYFSLQNGPSGISFTGSTMLWTPAATMSDSSLDIIVADTSGGKDTLIWNVSVVIDVQLLDTVNTPYWATSVDVRNNYAYVTVWDSALFIFDVSDSANPHYTGSMLVRGWPRCVSGSGYYEFVGDSRYLYSSYVYSPYNPSKSDSISIGAGYAFESVIVGANLYVATSAEGLKVIDINTPSSPSVIGADPNSGDAYGIDVFDNYAYVSKGSQGLRIYNISTPSSPTLTGQYDENVWPGGLDYNNGYVYMTIMYQELQIFDVSTPSAPSKIATFPNHRTTNDVEVSGDYAFVVSDSGLTVVDVSTPAQPMLAAEYRALPKADGVAVVNDLVYVAYGNGLAILKITRP